MARRRRSNRGGSDYLALLSEVATFYYVDRLTQEQIARQIGGSLAMVSRLISEAQERGIVQIRIRTPIPTDVELQTELAAHFHLRAARVLAGPALDPGQELRALGELAALYLKPLLTDDLIIGTGWGKTLYETVQAVGQHALENVHVVQSTGSLGSRIPSIDNHEVTRLLAANLGGTAHYIPAPMFVANPAVRNSLMQDVHIADTIEMGRRADIMLVGIGVPEPEYSGLLQAGYIDAATLQRIRSTGAVGDMFVEYYDIGGRILDVGIGAQVVGLQVSDLPGSRTVIAVAGGIYKAAAILGALRLGVIHVLVTDRATAQEVLHLAGAATQEAAA